MTGFLIVATMWAAIIVGAALWLASWYRPVRYANRVLVNLKSTGNAIEGVLVRDRGKAITVADAVMHLDTGGDPVPIDGRAVIYRNEIEFVQILPAVAP